MRKASRKTRRGWWWCQWYVGLFRAEHAPVPWGQSHSSADRESMDMPGGHVAVVGTRYPINEPLPESLKSVLRNQEHRWDVKWPSTDTWEYDWFYSPAFRCCVHPHCLTSPHLYICLLDVINWWKNAAAKE